MSVIQQQGQLQYQASSDWQADVMGKTTYKEMLLRHWQIVVRGLDTVDHVLRRRDWSESGSSHDTGNAESFSAQAGSQNMAAAIPLRKVVAIVLICGPIYGIAMGSYAFAAGERALVAQIPQLIYSGIKVPLLLCFTVAISLPSFFVINTLMGLREDFREALGAIVSAQAGLTLILVSLFPITLFVYSCLPPGNSSYALAVLFNAAMFAVASISAQVLLDAYYTKLVARNARHRWMVRLWIVVYAFVGIQAGYVLRPFIGSPSVKPSFLRRGSFENAYVKVFSLICDVLEDLFSAAL